MRTILLRLLVFAFRQQMGPPESMPEQRFAMQRRPRRSVDTGATADYRSIFRFSPSLLPHARFG